jgi:acetyl-CoA C-acetyltransferase
VGLHPFGRFEGKSAMEMGVEAILAAVADAGVAWKDVQFATAAAGRSLIPMPSSPWSV